MNEPSLWDALRDAAPSCEARRPSVGKRVRVLHGHQQGGVGTVKRHMRRYSNLFKYLPPGNAHLAEMCGTHGFVVLVEFDDQRPRKWIKANEVEILLAETDR